MPTVVNDGNGASVVAANLIQYHDEGDSPARATGLGGPIHTLDCANRHAVVASFLAHIQRDFGTSTGHPADNPLGTITCEGGGKANLVASFLAKYYGAGTGQAADEPIHTVPTIDRFGLVTVDVQGIPHVIADVAMRMLQPRELYKAQGFRDDYIIDRGADGRPITKTDQVRMCGNSVCPPLSEAIALANVPELIARPAKRKAC